MYCVERKGRRHPVYKKKHYYYLLLLCRWNIYYSSFLVYTVAMNFNHFGGQTDFGMLEMDIPVLCQQLKKEISFNYHYYLKIVKGLNPGVISKG